MAILVLLAAAAGTRIVAADIGLRKVTLHVRGFLVYAQVADVGMLELRLPCHRFGTRALRRVGLGHFLLAADAHPRQQ